MAKAAAANVVSILALIISKIGQGGFQSLPATIQDLIQDADKSNENIDLGAVILSNDKDSKFYGVSLADWIVTPEQFRRTIIDAEEQRLHPKGLSELELQKATLDYLVSSTNSRRCSLGTVSKKATNGDVYHYVTLTIADSGLGRGSDDLWMRPDVAWRLLQACKNQAFLAKLEELAIGQQMKTKQRARREKPEVQTVASF